MPDSCAQIAKNLVNVAEEKFTRVFSIVFIRHLQFNKLLIVFLGAIKECNLLKMPIGLKMSLVYMVPSSLGLCHIKLLF